jgi:c(7)-type cytochrome triheme protein
MSKTTLFILASLVFFCGVMFSKISFSVEIGPDKIILSNGGSCIPVLFEHWVHQEIAECGYCHHEVDDDGNRIDYTEEIKAIKCGSCHNSNMAKDDFNSVKKVGHSLCRKCHQSKDKKLSCPTCHNYSDK